MQTISKISDETVRDLIFKGYVTPYRVNKDKNRIEFWYNHIRTHQNLDKQTPESVYQKRIRELILSKVEIQLKENPPDD